MEQYLRGFCREYDYPAEAEETLAAALTATRGTPMGEALESGLKAYEEKGAATDLWDTLAAIHEAPLPEGVSRYTVELLYFILCSRHLRELYIQRGLPLDIYRDSMGDLRCKLFECHTVYGVWGSFVASWFIGFFRLERFAVGRLQYEERVISQMPAAVNSGLESFQVGEYTLTLSDKVMNVHIPSAGPLLPEDVADSFRRAAQFFADRFEGRVAFACSSWLLFPRHREFLPPTSRILSFMDFFTIVAGRDEPEGQNLWRIFGIDDTLRMPNIDIPSLPRDTGLRRAYYDWLMAGNLPGGGLGFHIEPLGKE